MTLQDAAVAVFVVAGASVLVRRLVRSLRPANGDAACPNCASGAAVCAKPAHPTTHDV